MRHSRRRYGSNMSPIPRPSDGQIRTLSGEMVGWQSGVPNVGDVLLGLGRLPRFVGQTSRYWTVLQHSLACHRIAEWWMADAPELGERLPQLPLMCLLHDVSEALTGDVPRPVKPKGWKAWETLMVERWAFAWGLKLAWSGEAWEAVHEVDEAALHAEGALFTSGEWSPGWETSAAVSAVAQFRHDPDGGEVHDVVRGILREAGADV